MGIGKSLIKFMAREASARNISHFHINTNEDTQPSNQNNIASRSLYKKLWDKKTGEMTVNGGCAADIVCLYCAGFGRGRCEGERLKIFVPRRGGMLT